MKKETPARTITPPPTRRDESIVDDYFGTDVADPYRWLEDDNSDETKAWVLAQNAVTESFLQDLPAREAYARRLRELWNYEKFGLPVKRGDAVFHTRNPGLLEQPLLVVARADDAAEARVLIDPNALSDTGKLSLSGWSPSPDGSLLAYGISEAGSDWTTWRVLEVASGSERGDLLRWTKTNGIAWLGDSSGFFYSRYEEPAVGAELTGATKNERIHLHRLGDSQEADELIYARPDRPGWFLMPGVSDDGRWLIIWAQEGTNPENAIYLKDLLVPGSTVRPFLERMDATYIPVGNRGETFIVYTNKDAPRGRLVAADVGRPAEEAWRELVPQPGDREVIEFGVTMAGGKIICPRTRDVAAVLTMHDIDGTLIREIDLPGLGSIPGISGRDSDDTAFFAFTSYDRPPTIFRIDASSGEIAAFRSPNLDCPLDSLEVSREFYASKDGTKVPIFLVRRRGCEDRGPVPTVLYGYGGFQISMTPGFWLSFLPWFERGGMLAVACLRGGNEYGKDWYDAGRLANKQNVFDDLIAAAEWLVATGRTATRQLAINGGSNGGLLVGACLTQRPDLFGAAVPEVGVLDMLRFHRFTVGWAWKSDYGSSETREGFETLFRYSPLHNIRPGTRYPATLVCTGDHDDRVVPAHSHKFTATLQACQTGDAPILTRIETDAGHGAGTPLSKIIGLQADKFAFLEAAIGRSMS